MARPAIARRRARRLRVGAAAAAGLALLAGPVLLSPAPRLLWNATPSAPVGLWRVSPGARVRVGDTVVAYAPPAVRQLAAARSYLPANVPLIKVVAATQGDHVCARGADLEIDGRRAAVRHKVDRRGRPLPWWKGCRVLGEGEVLLLTASPDSFDGRYFGPIPRAALVGKASPLWLR